jgi:hypothetical protein
MGKGTWLARIMQSLDRAEWGEERTMKVQPTFRATATAR